VIAVAAKQVRYVVVAPYITAVTGTPEGPRFVGFYTGAVLPDDISEESIKHHLDNEMIAPEGKAEDILAAAPGEVTTPTGSEAGSTLPGEEHVQASPPPAVKKTAAAK
jgi:hypothetical protein